MKNDACADDPVLRDPYRTAHMQPDILEELNAQQREAANAPGDAPLLVVAGAGTGKTNTLAHRVARLIERGTDPHRLLVLTFSRQAARELERRCGRILLRTIQSSAQPPTLPWSGTFHSIAARLLREYAPRIGLDAGFTIHDRSDSEDLLAMVREELGYAATRTRFPAKGTCIAIYSRVTNTSMSLKAVLDRHFSWCSAWESELIHLFERYDTAKQSQHVLDYDDLLLYLAQLVNEPEWSSEIGARFDAILVDEYQDTNHLQAALIRSLRPSGAGVTVVGDDAQSIYSFRAATIRNILDFASQFSLPTTRIQLERNYRSTPQILAASNAVIALASERYEKNLWSARPGGAKPNIVVVQDDRDQACYLSEQILAQRECGVPLKEQAVLMRTSSHSAALELELRRRNIPFIKYGGLKFFESVHVKDVISLLRWAENPRAQRSAFRCVQLLPGIGPATAAQLVQHLDRHADPVAALEQFTAPAAAQEHWPALVSAYRSLRDRSLRWPADLECAARWYTPHLLRRFDDSRVRLADLEQLAALAPSFGTRERFLTELALDPPAASSGEAGAAHQDEDYLILSTIHSAKGQEWNTVYLLNLVDGCIPSDMATGSSDEIEEERRLLYVAMTRARERLDLVVPRRFYVTQQTHYGDRHVYALRSRFVPDALLQHFDERTWPPPAQADQPLAPCVAAARPLDLASRARKRWS